jgi:hypothetical protein
MNKAEFVAALEYELRFRRRAFSRSEVQTFVAAAWRLIEGDPDIHRWVREFVNATRRERNGNAG